MFILSEANLGLLGLGVSEPLPSWGAMLRELENYYRGAAESLDAGAGGAAGRGGQLSAAPAADRGPRSMLRTLLALLLVCGASRRMRASELRFCLRADPKTFNPLLVEDESSETIRYLTGGVLIRLNRYTQELEGELATKWKVLENGRRIDFELRPNVLFSDGTPFTCEDVVFTMQPVDGSRACIPRPATLSARRRAPSKPNARGHLR